MEIDKSHFHHYPKSVTNYTNCSDKHGKSARNS